MSPGSRPNPSRLRKGQSRPATKIARPSTIRKRAIAVDPLRVVASILSALTEQLKQHHEKIYEVEIERQRTEHCLLTCDFGRVRFKIHLLDALRVVCGQTDEHDDADNGDDELKR